jgi:hypothetical protein
LSVMMTNLWTLLGVLVKDWRRYHRALGASGSGWLRLCNRYERLDPAPDGSGFRCDWQWTSVLHAPTVLPSLGRRLFARALAEYPIALAEHPAEVALTRPVDVSFVIGHRGLERLPHLLVTLRAIAGQRNARLECIVVEQSVAPEVQTYLPTWVRYVHTPIPNAGMLYCRAWAFNVGARVARGDLLILHDNDLLLPCDYTSEHLAMARSGFEVINLKRFIFYLTREATGRVTLDAEPLDKALPLDQILQNAQGGGSLVITRSAFMAIGGFDEAFVGWGGEDNELWDRVLTRKIYAFGRMPMIHLWHPPQAGKRAIQGRGRDTAALAEERARIPADTRIAELTGRAFGDVSGPGTPHRLGESPVQKDK